VISVCMAVFNGEGHLEEQIRSILIQLSADDEIIIVDDCSSDASISLIESISDSRIKLLRNAVNIGPAFSFERAISLASGQYIFLSDQDDIWRTTKVEAICSIFESTSAIVVVSDARIVDADRNSSAESLFSLRGSGQGFLRNLYKNGFVGCCMALRSGARAFLLPFPRQISMHDEWIGLCASLAGRVHFVDQQLLDYRRHDSNVTQMNHGALTSMIWKRAKLLALILLRLRRILSWRLQAIGQSRERA
jgi:glycosyltransferase involved in cell wall biosynthesis